MSFSVLLVSEGSDSSDAATSGTCGTNLTWSISGTTLTISGYEDMYSYPYYDPYNVPWYGNEITAVVLPYGLTSIGNYSFYGLAIESVSIPDTVTSLGYSAFGSCLGIRELALGSSVKSIGDYAFSGAAITKLVIPDSVETIGSSAFSGCNELRELTLGSSVKSIDNSAFYGTHLTELVIPDSVNTIGDNAFSNVPLRKIIVGDGLLHASGNSFGGIQFYNRDGSIQIEVNGSNMINTTFTGSNGILYSNNGNGIDDDDDESLVESIKDHSLLVISIVLVIINSIILWISHKDRVAERNQ